MKKNRRTFFVLLLAALVLLTAPLTVLASGSKHGQTMGQPVPDMSEPAKYVFVFIGDGMGLPQINAAKRYLSAIEGQVTGSKKLTISTLPAQGITTTYATDRFITGTAAAATAIATGKKTNIGVIAMDPTKTVDYKTVAEMAHEMGMKVGIISSVSIDPATPAAFYAHRPSRSMYYEIGVDLANSGFEFFGGGMTLGFAGTKYESSFDILAKQRRSATDYFAGTIMAEYKKTHTPKNANLMDLRDDIEEYFGLVWLDESGREAFEARADAGYQEAAMKLALSVTDFDLNQIESALMRSVGGNKVHANDHETYLLYGGYDPLSVTLSHILNQKTGIGWTSYSHTGVPVPTFALGVGAGVFNGYYDNTDTGLKVMEIMNVSEMVAMN